MRVQRVLMPDSAVESWTLLGDDLVPVEPVERFLAYPASIERSPNTIKAYAHDLKDWLAYLSDRRLDWRAVTLEQVAGFLAWLRLPPAARDGRVAVLPSVEHHCVASSVNRKLAAVTSFYEFHARHGVDVARLLVSMRPAGRRRGAATSYKPFLEHVAKGKPQRQRTVALKASRSRPRVLTVGQAQAILDACEHLRDRLLFALLLDTGVRIGEALGLRHEDMGIAERTVTVTPGANDNRARAKAGISRTIPASPELMRLYADYLNREYGALDSDYVFINLWADGNANLFPRMTANVDGRRSLGPDSYRGMLKRWLATCDVRDEHGQPVHLTPHQWRHTFATRLINGDVPQEVIRVLLDHESTQMTSHWAKTRYGMATQTLPNGYCGLPLQRSCPHANACLTCPVFLTGPEFLPELREQHRRTLTLIDASKDKGQSRMVEMNQQVLTNLDRMIGEIEKDQEDVADAG
jgi:integrase